MNKKQTSKKVASIASGILRDGRTSSKSKTVQQVHCHRQEKEENRDGFLCRSKKFKRNVRQSAK